MGKGRAGSRVLAEGGRVEWWQRASPVLRAFHEQLLLLLVTSRTNERRGTKSGSSEESLFSSTHLIYRATELPRRHYMRTCSNSALVARRRDPLMPGRTEPSPKLTTDISKRKVMQRTTASLG
jgi:hypothetical protein